MPAKFVVAILWFMVVSGCQHSAILGPQPLSELQRQQLGPILIQPRYNTAEDVSGVTTGKGMGAAKGAGQASAYWLMASAETGNPLTFAVGVLLTPVATLAGGVYGGVVADSAAEVDAFERTLQHVFDQTSVIYQRQLEQQVGALPFLPVTIATQPSEPNLSRVEINFSQLQGEGGGPKSELRFTLLAHTKVFQGASQEPIYERRYEVHSEVRRLSDWVSAEGQLLLSAIDQLAYTTVMEILNDHFLDSPYKTQPLFPAKNFVFKPQRLATTAPEFRWVLREGRRELGAQAHAGLAYELRVLDDQGGMYEADEISDNTYRFDEALPVCGTYGWSVRASYQVYGQPRFTSWSPQQHFRTPCPK